MKKELPKQLFFLFSFSAVVALPVKSEGSGKIHGQHQQYRYCQLYHQAGGSSPGHIRQRHRWEAEGNAKHHHGKHQARDSEQPARQMLGEPPGVFAAHAEVAPVAQVIIGLLGGQNQIGQAQQQYHHRANENRNPADGNQGIKNPA